MGNLLSDEPILYERADGVVYARYENKPEIPRWIIGGDPGAVARANGDLLHYADWQDLCRVAATNAALRKQLEEVVVTYYLLKEHK